MSRRHIAINPQPTMLRGSAGCAVATARGTSEYQLSKPAHREAPPSA